MTRQDKIRHKAALKQLSSIGVIGTHTMGVRKLICASSGQAISQGFNLPEYLQNTSTPSLPLNFHPGSRRWDAWVRYQDRRAKIAVTSGHPDWQNTPCDVSTHFRVNDAAMDLLRQPTTKWIGWNPGPIPIYGDAVLITEYKQHWWMWRDKLSVDEILFAHENLFTPRSLYLDDSGNPYIHFLEKPQIDDLAYLKLAFYE